MTDAEIDAAVAEAEKHLQTAMTTTASRNMCSYVLALAAECKRLRGEIADRNRDVIALREAPVTFMRDRDAVRAERDVARAEADALNKVYDQMLAERDAARSEAHAWSQNALQQVGEMRAERDAALAEVADLKTVIMVMGRDLQAEDREIGILTAQVEALTRENARCADRWGANTCELPKHSSMCLVTSAAAARITAITRAGRTMSRKEAFDLVFDGMLLTRDQREIQRLRGELSEAYKRAADANADLMAIRHLFRLGWRSDEDQWRVPKEVVLESGLERFLEGKS